MGPGEGPPLASWLVLERQPLDERESGSLDDLGRMDGKAEPRLARGPVSQASIEAVSADALDPEPTEGLREEGPVASDGVRDDAPVAVEEDRLEPPAAMGEGPPLERLPAGPEQVGGDERRSSGTGIAASSTRV